MAKTILIVAQVIDEVTGAVEDANTTIVSGQDQAAVDAWKADFQKFGEEQTQKATSAGVPASAIKQHRHSGHHGHGKP